MRIPLLVSKTTNGGGDEYHHMYPGRDVEGVNIQVWGTIGDATLTLQFKAPNDTWVNTSCTFTTTGMKNFLLKGDTVVRLNVTGAGSTDVSADLKP